MNSSVMAKRARAATGLSCRAFAEAAGVSPSTVTRIENGSMDPTFGTLQRILAAAGEYIEVTPGAAMKSSHAPTLMLVRAHRESIEQLAAEHGVRNVRVFGSVARGTADSDSDLDLLVQAQPSAGLLAVESFRAAVEELIGWPVDVVTEGATTGVFSNIEQSAVAL